MLLCDALQKSTAVRHSYLECYAASLDDAKTGLETLSNFLAALQFSNI